MARKRQTRKKMTYFANLGRTLRSVGYKGKISNLKTVEAREALLLNRKWDLDEGPDRSYSRKTLDFIKKTSKPSSPTRKNPASKLTPKLKKEIEQDLKNLRMYPHLPARTKVLKKGTHRGHRYVLLDTGSWEEKESPYMGIILGGGYTHGGRGWAVSEDLPKRARMKLKLQLARYPTARSYETDGILKVQDKLRKGYRGKKNPANQQNLLIGAIAAFAGYKMYKG